MEGMMEDDRVHALRAEKTRLRSRFREARLGLSEADYAARSAQIRARLLALPEVAAARAVHVYWPLVDRREVDTRPLIATLHARGVAVVLPVVIPQAEGSPPRLRQVRFEGVDRLRPNRWHLLEPEGPDHHGPLDVVVVPAFGAGRNGHRIGHGAGYYDAFLSDLSARGLHPFTVCPVFQTCLVSQVPAEPHDHAVDAVVSEQEVVRP